MRKRIQWDISEIFDNAAKKYFAITPSQKLQFLYGEFESNQKKQPAWVGVDYSDSKDRTIKFKHTGSVLEII